MHASIAKPISELETHILATDFPCVGAKSALHRGQLQEVIAGDLRSDQHDSAILEALGEFIERNDRDAVFVTFAVMFPDTPLLDEASFETALWQRLAALHQLDALQHNWDPRVSSDPAAANFSMSLGGHAFYVVGMHPGASRQARRLASAAIVFNPHQQFEILRAEGRYEGLRQTVATRDLALAGSRNPMLAAHGTASAANQYSGRAVGNEWTCPFKPSKARP